MERGIQQTCEKEKVQKNLTANGMQCLSTKSRFVSTYCSNSINDSSFLNCNRRYMVDNNGGLEAKLWGIASDLGISCLRDKEVIFQKFRELE